MPPGSPSQPVTGSRSDTIVARFINRATVDPERVAYVMYPIGALQQLGSLKWGDWITNSRAAAGAFLARHAEPGDRVAVFADNRVVWPVASMAAAMCGLVTVAIPPNGSAAQVAGQLIDSGSTYVVVDTMVRFKLIRSLLHLLPQSLTIICDDLEPLRSSVAEGVFEWETWCRYGAQALNDYELLRKKLSLRIDAIDPAHVSSITYGVEDNVGIVRTFDTAMTDALVVADAFQITHEDRVAVSRSLSDPFQSCIAITIPVLAGSTVALIEHESDAFGAVRNFGTTVFASGSSGLRRVGESLLKARIGDGYVRDAACEFVGRHCRLIVAGNEIGSAELHQDLQAAGIALATIFGTEMQTCICVNGPRSFEGETIGVVFASVDARIGDYAELLVRRSAHTASGSFTRSDRIDALISVDGEWLRTGHRVERSMAGVFRIVGQMAEMMEFTTGRLVAPHDMEQQLAALPLVAHAMCQADGANSIVAVLSLNRKKVEDWAFLQGIVAPWEALVEHPVVYDELARGVREINEEFDASERVAAFAATDLEFSVNSGELDVAGKIVRDVVASRFRHVFAELHQHRSV